MRTLTTVEQSREVERIKDVGAWPLGTVLPVKNLYTRDSSGIPLLGVLRASEGVVSPVIYKGANLFNLRVIKLDEDLKACEQVKFEDIEGLVAAGWVGD